MTTRSAICAVPDIGDKHHVPALAAAVDAGSDRTTPRRRLVTLISTLPSGCVVTAGVTVALFPCRHADRPPGKRVPERIGDLHLQRIRRCAISH